MKRTRTKCLLTSILLIWLLVILSACQKVPLPRDAKAGLHSPDGSSDQKRTTPPNDFYGRPTRIGFLEDRAINESSGIVSSRTSPGMYWTHNDSGDGPFIYAFDDRGQSKGVWRVTGATAYDWEDIAAGPGPSSGINYLYIGDIGDNGEKRSQIIIYRVPEPFIAVADASSRRSSPRLT